MRENKRVREKAEKPVKSVRENWVLLVKKAKNIPKNGVHAHFRVSRTIKKNTTADDGTKVTIPAPANVGTKVTIPALNGKTGGADNGTFMMVFLQGAAAAKWRCR